MKSANEQLSETVEGLWLDLIDLPWTRRNTPFTKIDRTGHNGSMLECFVPRVIPMVLYKAHKNCKLYTFHEFNKTIAYEF